MSSVTKKKKKKKYNQGYFIINLAKLIENKHKIKKSLTSEAKTIFTEWSQGRNVCETNDPHLK